MLEWEHSAILSTFMKLPFVIKIFGLYIFEWPFYTGFTVKCLFDLILYVQVNNFSVMLEWVFLGWASAKQGLICLAQGHNVVTPMRPEPATPRSQVKPSTTEPLGSLKIQCTFSVGAWWCSVTACPVVASIVLPSSSSIRGVGLKFKIYTMIIWNRHT